MGMSASQVRLLSLTSRMHDLEYEAQVLDYSKLELSDLKNAAYTEYEEALDSTKVQMSVVTADGIEYEDVTYQNMVMANTSSVHSMYILKDNSTGQIVLPEQIASELTPMPNTLEDFLEIVGSKYLYSGRSDLTSQEDYISEMKSDGNYNYWKSVYYMIGGYEDDTGNLVSGTGFTSISKSNAVDRDWLIDALNNGEVSLYKMTTDESMYDGNAINIFAETSLSTDEDLVEVANDELIEKARIEYEKAIDDVDAKDSKLDLQLAQIETEHNALKTEYDSVKQIVSKNIERSFKTFNA
ncbi:MAG: hypothetical protein LUB59_02395 [Candidatus Gastranaerophilales bacterium]|nr:hypothetical protein [Candidatus Gastranaerophilales bacterium]